MASPVSAPHLKYKPYIDGLRGVSILAVLLYHYGVGSFSPGGFVGVDVFFVVSGYLITTIIYQLALLSQFNFYEFFARRMLRLLPAALVVYLFVLALSLLLFFPDEVGVVAKSSAASTLFISNFYFFQTSGYFERAAQSNPLLHTWSLSVEEQFYLVFPLLLLWLVRRSINVKAAIAAIAVTCFALTQFLIDQFPEAVFYLLPFRGWELLMGAFVAVLRPPTRLSRFTLEFLCFAGLALIFASIALLDRQSQFPGLLAIPACLGAALIIYCGRSFLTLTSLRLLSFPPLRYFGLISYSLYLWHWPLVVFYPYVFGRFTHTGKLLLIFVAIALAHVSWKFIETPFRQLSDFRNPRRAARIVHCGLGALAACTLIAMVTWHASGLYFKPSPEIASILSHIRTTGPDEWRVDSCFIRESRAKGDGVIDPHCLRRKSDMGNVLLFGDSHAAHYYPGLVSEFSDRNVMQATAAGCKPALEPKGAEYCRNLIRFVIDSDGLLESVDTVVLAARWQHDDLRNLEILLQHFKSRRIRVVVLGPIQEYSQPLPRILALSASSSRHVDINDFLISGIASVDENLRALTKKLDVDYISVYNELCKASCITLAERTPLQYDYGHLSLDGSRLVVKLLGARLRKAFSARQS